MRVEQTRKEKQMEFNREAREWEDEVIQMICKDAGNKHPKLAMLATLGKLSGDCEAMSKDQKMSQYVFTSLKESATKDQMEQIRLYDVYPHIWDAAFISGIKATGLLIEQYLIAFNDAEGKHCMELLKRIIRNAEGEQA